MLKRIFLAALWLPLTVLAQSYPSPHFNNVTIDGTLSVTGAPVFTTPVPTASGGLGANNGTATGVPVFSAGTATVTAATGSGAPVLGTSPSIVNPTVTGSLTATTSNETQKWASGQNIIVFPGQNTDFSDNAVTQSNSGSHSGATNSATSIVSTVTGSGANGPTNADYGQYMSVIKNNFLTSAAHGEIDGLSIVTRQGQDDTDGILINSGGVAGYMGLIEGNVNQFQATTGTILLGMDAQLGYIETGLTGTADSGGLALVANVGTFKNGILIHSLPGAGWNNAITVAANNNGANTFTVTPAGLVTASGGISGVTSGAAAATGTLGENQSTSTASTSMTSGTTANCTSKSLPAGDWLVWGVIQFNPAASTTVSSLYAGISTTSATLPGAGLYTNINTSYTTGQSQQIAAPFAIENLSSPTTVYLVGNSTFGTSTMACNGYIYAVRYY